jgi:hypothetical protein
LNLKFSRLGKGNRDRNNNGFLKILEGFRAMGNFMENSGQGSGMWGLQFYTFFGISIGITRRLIDIGKKITFYFLQNV